MEAEPVSENYQTEYTSAQLAIRALDEQISRLRVERSKWVLTCHQIVARAMEAGVQL